MNVLLVDIGNTRIKWARFDGRSLGRLRAAAHVSWDAQDYARNVIGSGRRFERIIVASVAGERANRSFTLAARRAQAPAPEIVISRRRAGGVERVLDAGRKHNVAVGHGAATPTGVSDLRNRGFAFVGFGPDYALLTGAARAGVEAFRQTSPATAR